MPRDLDLSLYALLGPAAPGARAPAVLAAAVAEGGATLLQWRDKDRPTRASLADLRELKAALTGRVPLLVNDRVDLALAAEADGVHLGQDDMPPADARRLLGPRAIIGLTVKNAAQVADAPLDAIDYLAIGGVFATTSKDNPDPPVGLDGLRRLAAAARARAPRLPLCAIAGIDESNAASVIAAGVDGVAVISALSAAADPAAAARALRAVVAAAKEGR